MEMFENGYLSKSPLATWIHRIAGSYKCSDWGHEREVTDLLKVTRELAAEMGLEPWAPAFSSGHSSESQHQNAEILKPHKGVISPSPPQALGVN